MSEGIVNMRRIIRNRLFGQGLYLEVYTLFQRECCELTNNKVRDLLSEQYELHPDERVQLLERVRHTTERLMNDGRLDRREAVTERKHLQYHYRCSTSK